MHLMTIEAPQARPAATVALVRDGPRGLQTWMMRRVPGMAFAAGACVFPGGRVDESDADVSIRWHGNTPEWFAERLGVEVTLARAVVTAAVRELFEESGVLLTVPPLTNDLEAARHAVESRTTGLSGWLAEQSCVLDVSGLRPWGRWVTPLTEPRRFDTWFFVAVVPTSVEARSATTEAESAGWFDIQHLLDSAASRQLHVLPPTIVMLRGLLRAGSVSGVLEAAETRPMGPVYPQVQRNEDGTVLVRGGGEEVTVRP